MHKKLVSNLSKPHISLARNEQQMAELLNKYTLGH